MTKVPEILIVDDDPALCDLLSDQLEMENDFHVTKASNLGQARHILSDKSYHCDGILLDILLSDGDGRDFCAELRNEGFNVPIIMLTGVGEEGDVVRGLEAGANDYVIKPFRRKELLARLKAQIRIFENSEDATFPIGPYLFHPSARFLTSDNGKSRIRLTDKETSILKFLYRNGEESVGRDVLLNEVWGCNSAVTTHTLETHIYRLRQKMEPDPSHVSLLTTEDGGYRLNVGN